MSTDDEGQRGLALSIECTLVFAINVLVLGLLTIDVLRSRSLKRKKLCHFYRVCFPTRLVVRENIGKKYASAVVWYTLTPTKLSVCARVQRRNTDCARIGDVFVCENLKIIFTFAFLIPKVKLNKSLNTAG